MNIKTNVLAFAVTIAFAGAAAAQSATPATPADPAVAASATTSAVPATPAIPATPAVTPPETTEARDPMTEADVRALLISEGYTEINDVEFEEGTWTADAKSADGNHIEVRIDSKTGKVFPDKAVATIGKDEVIVKIQAAGYTNVHDVEMEDGVWKVEANNSAGDDVELKVDPNTGEVIGSEKDVVGAKH